MKISHITLLDPQPLTWLGKGDFQNHKHLLMIGSKNGTLIICPLHKLDK